MAKPKCKYCGKELDRKEAFSTSGKSPYFCNEEEYRLYYQPKWDKDEFVQDTKATLSLMWDLTDSGWNIVKGALLTWYNEFGKEKMEAYLETKIELVNDIIRNRSFDTNSSKARYIVAILRNSIRDFMEHYTPEEEREEVHVVKDFYMPSQIKYTPKKRPRAMRIIEEEDD